MTVGKRRTANKAAHEARERRAEASESAGEPLPDEPDAVAGDKPLLQRQP
jgi:hypothetical protein